MTQLAQRFHMVSIGDDESKGEGEDDAPTAYTNVYVRTATLDPVKNVGFLQPLQGRTHQIKQMLARDQKAFLKHWLQSTHPSAWEEAGDHFQDIFECVRPRALLGNANYWNSSLKCTKHDHCFQKASEQRQFEPFLGQLPKPLQHSGEKIKPVW